MSTKATCPHPMLFFVGEGSGVYSLVSYFSQHIMNHLFLIQTTKVCIEQMVTMKLCLYNLIRFDPNFPPVTRDYGIIRASMKNTYCLWNYEENKLKEPKRTWQRGQENRLGIEQNRILLQGFLTKQYQTQITQWPIKHVITMNNAIKKFKLNANPKKNRSRKRINQKIHNTPKKRK